jgi:hypothetical protein
MSLLDDEAVGLELPDDDGADAFVVVYDEDTPVTP